jgi:hypothetical protein
LNQLQKFQQAQFVVLRQPKGDLNVYFASPCGITVAPSAIALRSLSVGFY